MVSISRIIDQIKRDPSSVLACLSVREVCGQLGIKFRQRVLDPATTVGLFIKQIANGNSSCAKVRHLGEREFTAQAYCEARMRLPLAVIATLSRHLCDAVRLIMLEAADGQNTQPDRISFADVLGWVNVAQPGKPMPRFIINKHRPGRVEPRVKKRRPKPFDLMNQPRQKLREALKNRGKAS